MIASGLFHISLVITMDNEIGHQYLSNYCIPKIQWPKPLTTERQLAILEQTINSPLTKSMPVSNPYAVSFMKKLMSKIEEDGQEIADETYECFGALMYQPSQEVSFKHYYIPAEKTRESRYISLQESRNMVSEGTTGLKTWQASQYLAEHLMSTQLLEGRNVIELGCGLGLLGLVVCSRFSCGSYVLTDHHPSVLKKAQANIEKNADQLKTLPSVAMLDWEQEESVTSPDIQEHVPQLDVILASDVVFDDRIVPSLVSTLGHLLRHGRSSCCAYISSTIRNPETYQILLDCLGKECLEHRVISKQGEQVFFYETSPKIEIIMVKLFQ